MAPKMILVFCDGTGIDGLRSGKTASVQGEARSSSELTTASGEDVQVDVLQGNVVSDGPKSAQDLDLEPLPPVEFAPDCLVDPSMEAILTEEITTDPFTMPLADRNLQGGALGSAVQNASNVLRLSRAVENLAASGAREQIVLYQSGVGSQADFNGDEVGSDTMNKATGTAVASKIRDAYAFIAQNYQDGDEICLFGFSRGAYAARKIAALIYRIGLLKRIHLGFFFAIWRELNEGKNPTIPLDTPKPKIKCVGVWDTVGTILGTIDALNIDDKYLPPNVEFALHAMSLQENREKFLPVLWSVPSVLPEGQIVKQVWFPGAHGNVGGGCDRHELSDIALFWMAGEIASFVNLDNEMLMAGRQIQPDPWGTSQPRNAYEDTPPLLRWLIGHKTRLENRDITATDSFHESIKYAPTTIVPNAEYMITFDTVRRHFGDGFKPVYPPLNDFENECKQRWKSGFQGPGVIYEDVSQLFDSP